MRTLALLAALICIGPTAAACPPKPLSSAQAKLLDAAEVSIEALLGAARVMREQGSIQHAAMLDEHADALQTALGSTPPYKSIYCACLKARKPAHKAACAATPSTPHVLR